MSTPSPKRNYAEGKPGVGRNTIDYLVKQAPPCSFPSPGHYLTINSTGITLRWSNIVTAACTVIFEGHEHMVLPDGRKFDRDDCMRVEKEFNVLFNHSKTKMAKAAAIKTVQALYSREMSVENFKELIDERWQYAI